MADIIAIKSEELRTLSADLAKLSGDLAGLDQDIQRLENALREDVSAIGKYGGSILLTGSIGGQRAFVFQAQQLSVLSDTAGRAADLAEEMGSSQQRSLESLPTFEVKNLSMLPGAYATAAGGILGILRRWKCQRILKWMRENWNIVKTWGDDEEQSTTPEGQQPPSGTEPPAVPVDGQPLPSINREIPIYNQRSGSREEDKWPPGYSGSSGCGVASAASALTGLLGREVFPKDVMACNSAGNPEYMLWNDTIKNTFGVKLDARTNLTGNKDRALQLLDDALVKYQTDPDTYAAPIIGCPNPQHFVVVTGKNPDGTYNIADSSGSYAGIYRYESDPGKVQLKSRENGGFAAQIASVRQFHK